MNRTLAAVLSLAVVAGGASAVVFVPTALAANTLNCSSFPNQAAAQTQLRIDFPGDPNRLDTNHNGIACEKYQYVDKTHDYTRTGIVDPPPPVPGGATVKVAPPNVDRTRTDVPK